MILQVQFKGDSVLVTFKSLEAPNQVISNKDKILDPKIISIIMTPVRKLMTRANEKRERERVLNNNRGVIVGVVDDSMGVWLAILVQ